MLDVKLNNVDLNCILKDLNTKNVELISNWSSWIIQRGKAKWLIKGDR